jgi:hypothetical protein
MRKAEALFAAGRDDEARAIAMESFVEFEAEPALRLLGVGALLDGDDESAIPWLEKLWIATDRNSAEVRPLVNGARVPESGKDFLANWVRSAVASSPHFDVGRRAYFWYLPFGYVDDYWNAIHMLRDGIDRGWTNADLLEHGGMVWRRSGFAQHPEYLPRSRAQGLTELWDVRGAPDHCSKDTGEWVCE